MRCYTIFDDLGAGRDNDPYKWRRGGPDIELDLVSAPHRVSSEATSEKAQPEPRFLRALQEIDGSLRDTGT